MSHACHRFWKCYKTLTFCSLLVRYRIPCACHAKQHLNIQKRFNPVDLEMCFASQRHALFQHLNFQKCSEPVLCTFWFRNVLRATTACTFSTSQLRKVLGSWGALHILTSKCASRHKVVCFCPHRSFEKCSEHEVFLAFWLRNVLRATTAYNFSSLILPDGSAPAALASLLFDPPGPQIIGKTQCFAPCLLFAHLDLLSSQSFFSPLWPFSFFFSSFLWSFSFFLPCVVLSSLRFSSLTLPTSVSSSVHTVGSLTSKLPSIMLRARRLTFCNYSWDCIFQSESSNPGSTMIHSQVFHTSLVGRAVYQSPVDETICDPLPVLAD